MNIKTVTVPGTNRIRNYCFLLLLLLLTAACSKKDNQATNGTNQSDDEVKKIEALYTNCASTKNKDACDELVQTIKSSMSPDKAKMNLEKLCSKYGIQQACER